MTGHQINLGKGWRIGKDGKLRRVAKDASAAARQKPGGSKRSRPARHGEQLDLVDHIRRDWQKPL